MPKAHIPPKLAAPSDSTPILDALFLQKAVKIEIASATPAAGISSETARLKPEGSPPRMDRQWIGAPEWRERWAECANHHSRLQVLKKMDRQLGVSVVDRRKVRGTLEWKLGLATDRRASAVVAAGAGISPSRVRQLRMDYVEGRLFKK